MLSFDLKKFIEKSSYTVYAFLYLPKVELEAVKKILRSFYYFLVWYFLNFCKKCRKPFSGVLYIKAGRKVRK